MKYIKEIAIIILTVMLILAVSNYFFNPNVEVKKEIEYLPGKVRDSISIVHDTIEISYPIYIPAKVDTFYASIIKKDTEIIDSIVAKSKFNIPVTDSSGVSGEVKFTKNMFTFKEVKMWYPEITHTMTKIDTILTTVTLETNNPLKQIYWFYSTVLLLILFLIK